MDDNKLMANTIRIKNNHEAATEFMRETAKSGNYSTMAEVMDAWADKKAAPLLEAINKALEMLLDGADYHYGKRYLLPFTEADELVELLETVKNATK